MENARIVTYDPEEMRRFGFDPDSQEDRLLWASTTPPAGIPLLNDYSEDVFEFGAPPAEAADIHSEQQR